MKAGRPQRTCSAVCWPAQQASLRHWLRCWTLPHGVYRRLRTIVLLSHGVPVREVARRVGVHAQTVRRWHRQWTAEGLGVIPARARRRHAEP